MLPVVIIAGRVAAGAGLRMAGRAAGTVGSSALRGVRGMGLGVQIHPGDIRDLNRALRQVDRALSKELGQVHRDIGERVIREVGGASTGVGSGRGERIRPSAAADRIQLLVGGGHRSSDPRRLQWGRVQRWPGGQAPQRPYIIEAAYSITDEIEQMYLAEVERIGRKAGFGIGAGRDLSGRL